MKKILFLLLLVCITAKLTAQGAGIRYVSGLPTAANYTPKINKGEATRCYSTTAHKYYRWEKAQNAWVEETNVYDQNFFDGGGIQHYSGGSNINHYFSLGADSSYLLPLVQPALAGGGTPLKRYIFNNGFIPTFSQYPNVPCMRFEGYSNEETRTFIEFATQDYSKTHNISWKEEYLIHTFNSKIDNRFGSYGIYDYNSNLGNYMSFHIQLYDAFSKSNNEFNLDKSNLKINSYNLDRPLDGTPNSVAWFDDDGFLRKSPVSSIAATTTNTLANDGYNQLTSTVNNVSSATPIISSLSHSVSGNTLTTTINNVQAAVVLPSPSGASYTAGPGISIANNVITNTAPNQNQTLSLTGQTLSLTNGGSVTLPSGGNNIYNSDGTIPNGVTRTVSIPDQNIVPLSTKLVFDASSISTSFYKPQLYLDVRAYKDAAFSSGLNGSNLQIDFGGYGVNTSSKLKVLCEPNQSTTNSMVALREITMGIPDLPQSNGLKSIRTNLHTNGKPEKVAWVDLTLTNIQTPNTLCSQFSTGVNNTPFDTHKVTIFDPTTKKYLEAFYVENIPINGGFRTNCYVFNPVGMYNPNQTGGSVQALIYYTE